MDYKKLSSDILHLVGGRDNVVAVTNCLTRLRFNLKDESKANDEAIKALDGVSGLVKKGGQYQVVIGTEVPSVYNALSKLIGDLDTPVKSTEKMKWSDRLIDTLSGIFTPILMPLTAAGMLKAVLAILVALHWVDSTSMTYQVINFMADSTFYFLPIFLANSAAKKFGCSPMLAMMLGGILLHPNFVSLVSAANEGGQAVSVFGLPIMANTYSSSVIPIILGVWFMSKVEPIADKISPKAVKFFTRPLLTILVSGIVLLVVLGPVGYIIADWIGTFFTTLNTYANWLVPTIIGAVLPFLVMTGTHHALTSIGINNRMTIGFDTFIYPGQLASNVAQGAAALALSLRTKDPTDKEMSWANGLTAVFGITEPVLFSVTIKHKTNMIAASIGGAVGGFFMGLLNVKNFSGGSPGLLTLPSYIGLDAPMSNFYLACIGAAIAFVVAFIVSFILNTPKKMNHQQEEISVQSQSKKKEYRDEIINAPLKGKAIDLKDVNDPTFSQGIMGQGGAIIPEIGELYAPCDGKINTVFKTKHAITLTSNCGAEVIIHIGIDTVKLEGKYFDIKVKDGDVIQTGDILGTFNLNKIKEAGYDVVTPIIIANSSNYQKIGVAKGDITNGDHYIELKV